MTGLLQDDDKGILFTLSDFTEYHFGQYVCANLFWKVQSFMTVAIEYLWGQKTNSSGQYGRANRINAMVQFNF